MNCLTLVVVLLVNFDYTTSASKDYDSESAAHRGTYKRNNAESCLPFLPLTSNRKCGRGCSAGNTCRNEKRRCLCDGVCGRSCVIASRPCIKPKLDNGKVEIVPYNRFGAEAIYSCDNEFVLSGPSRRVCQGDGQWSDEEPRCEKEVMCTTPPIVRNSFHNGFPEDDNARYSIGTQIRYTCLPGFQMYGFPKAMCLAGRWMGPRLACSPRNCGDPGPFPNGRQEGLLYYFGNSVVFICDTGFELTGDSFRKCQANGTWSGIQPRCVAIQCPTLHPPPFGSILSQNTSVGGIMKATCQPGYWLQGDEERVCQRDRRWSGRRANCTKIECGEIGPLHNGRVIYSGSGLGAVAYFRCDQNTVLSPHGAAVRSQCSPEGKWSDPAPKCLANCRVIYSSDGSLLVNGTKPLPYGYITSGDTVHLSCFQGGYRLYPAVFTLQCNNGTWHDIANPDVPISTLPTCQPLSCTEPPPPIENGLIRWRPSTHGERAFYVCIAGYVLGGNDSTTCQFGQWIPTGSMPSCRESFCSYPGPLQNGEIVILGRFGLYEFTPEVNKLRHGEQIEFGCKTDYRLIGQRKATCVNGRWTPAFKPVCIQNSVYYNMNSNNNPPPQVSVATEGDSSVQMIRSGANQQRGVASVQLHRGRRNSETLKLSRSCEAVLSAEYRHVEAVSTSVKVAGEQPGQGNTTKLPTAIEVSLISEKGQKQQGQSTGSETVRINCPPGYRSVPPDGLATCIGGKWYPVVPSCISIRLSSSIEMTNNSSNYFFNKKRAHRYFNHRIMPSSSEGSGEILNNRRRSYYMNPFLNNRGGEENLFPTTTASLHGRKKGSKNHNKKNH